MSPLARLAILLPALIALGPGAGPPSAAARDLTAAGSTFAYPVMVKWADRYHGARGTKVNYQSIGSGGGTKQIIARTVDFALSDVPMEPGRLNEFGLEQAPLVRGKVVPVLNLRSIRGRDLKLGGALLADIFGCRVTRWDDPALKRANPGLALPDAAITTVHRADGSGTTYTLTKFLAEALPSWRDQVGVGTAVRWPCGVGGKGNDGVGAFVKRIAGSIGYVEAAFVRAGHLQAALTPLPILATTFVLSPRAPHQSKSVYDFLAWAVRDGGGPARQLGFDPLEGPERDRALAAWGGGP